MTQKNPWKKKIACFKCGADDIEHKRDHVRVRNYPFGRKSKGRSTFYCRRCSK